MAKYLDENFDRVRTNPARDIENSQTLRNMERRREEAEITAREQAEYDYTKAQQALKTMQERDAKSTQAVLQGAAQSMLDPNTQKCERQAPAGYEAEKKALLHGLEASQQEASQAYARYEAKAREQRDLYDRLQRAILIVGNYPHFELLSELLKLRVL